MNLPGDFIKKMQDMLADDYPQFLECYEKDRYQALRLNPLKKGLTEELATSVLQKFGAAEQVPWEPSGYYYGEQSADDTKNLRTAADETGQTGIMSPPRPGKHAYHEAGLYYIQEPSAMSAAALLAPRPGMRVLDLCAAPGGKTTQLAGYLMQSGLLVANEIHPARAKILSQNVERMGIANAIVTNEDSGRLAARFPSFFHAILVDAPCSGEGMFRKNPEAMEEWSADQVLVCAERQREILENAARMLLPGGTLCYSTCTFSREENEETIDYFLARHPEFSVKDVAAPWFEKDSRQGTFRLWPHKLHGEGHFAAVLQKAGVLPELHGGNDAVDDLPDSGVLKCSAGRTTPSVCDAAGRPYIAENRKNCGNSDRNNRKNNSKNNSRNRNSNTPDRARLQQLEEFLTSAVSEDVCAWIMRGSLTLFGDQLYRLPDDAPELNGIRVLRAGLHIGEFKKNRFEPSHALALYLGLPEVTCAVSLPAESAEITGFLRGESIFPDEAERTACLHTGTTGTDRGWCLVCADSCSLGWGKLAGNQIKNHYPKGLRK